MKEKEKNIFYDISTLSETENIRSRCNTDYINNKLVDLFPDEKFTVVSVQINESGKYINKSQGFIIGLLPMNKMEGVPPYCSVIIEHITGKHSERIVVWSPLKWNDRFVGAPGGGTSTGGEKYINRPNNTSRSMTLPKGILNGFTAATTDAGAKKNQWAFDENGKLDLELIENWRAKSTHFMTLIGKAVAEILHERTVKYSYLHGGSGGGRQSMTEAQEFPNDYNGIWASCPAINWTKFIIVGHWPIAVMNSNKHKLSPKKIKFFMEAAQNSVGGKKAYYSYEKKVDFDPLSLVGQKCKGGVITEKDAIVMREIWDGPHSSNGERLWYSFRPGVLFWNVFIPIGAFYYTLIAKKPKPFFLSTHYARWVTENPKQTFLDINKEEFYKLFEQSVQKFPNMGADNADLSAFYKAGGKLIIDHGIDDPLIPVDGTIDYFDRVCAFFGGKEKVDEFCRLYITPGDGHGSCNWHGPGITDSDGMDALVNWVENGKAPGSLRTVQVDRKGKTICESTQKPV